MDDDDRELFHQLEAAFPLFGWIMRKIRSYQDPNRENLKRIQAWEKKNGPAKNIVDAARSIGISEEVIAEWKKKTGDQEMQ